MKDCVRCGDKLIYRPTWVAMSLEERAEARARGENKDGTRGLCHRCASYCRKHDLLIDYERKTVSGEDVREEWEAFYNHAEPKAPQIKILAPRLGMSVPALNMAVHRMRSVHDS